LFLFIGTEHKELNIDLNNQEKIMMRMKQHAACSMMINTYMQDVIDSCDADMYF